MSTSDYQQDGNGEHIALTRITPVYLLKNTPKGRGVFASQLIPAGTVIDTCPVLILPPEENTAHIEKTVLYHYTYNWPLPNPQNPKSTIKTQAVVFGLGSMFNHSSTRQNVGWTRNLESEVVIYRALRDIEVGEELCISYGAPGQLTFVDAEAEDVARDEAEEEKDGEEMLGRIEV